MEKIVIAIDTMGTDNGSAYFVQGIAEAMDLYDDLSRLYHRFLLV